MIRISILCTKPPCTMHHSHSQSTMHIILVMSSVGSTLLPPTRSDVLIVHLFTEHQGHGPDHHYYIVIFALPTHFRSLVLAEF